MKVYLFTAESQMFDGAEKSNANMLSFLLFCLTLSDRNTPNQCCRSVVTFNVRGLSFGRS